MAQLRFIVTIIVIALACVFAEELYSDKFDNIDENGILADEKLRLEYYNCFMDAGPCKTADQQFFRGIIAEAIQTNCKKCTKRQKEMLATMIDWYGKNEPDQWTALIKKLTKA